jgi:hypothetical protein
MNSKTWTKEAGKMEAFTAFAIAEAVRCGRLADDPGRGPESDDILALLGDFMNDTAMVMSDYATLENAKSAFTRWIGRPRNISPAPGQSITCQMTKVYGQLSVTFGWSGTFDLQTPSDAQEAFAYAVGMVENQFAAYQRTGLASSPAMTPPTSTSGPESRVTFTGDTLEVENRGGTLYYKVKGGQWKKHGVRVWPEVLKVAGLPPDQLYPGEFKLGRVCTVEMDGTKPKKVISIE